MRLAIFFNNSRGYLLLKKLKKKHIISLAILSSKFLNKKYISQLKKMKINFLIVKNVNDNKIFLLIKKLKIDLNIVAGFPYILNKKLICSAKYKSINLHAGPIPSYRGGSPLNWQIINGEDKIYLSIIKMTEKIDKGKLLAEGKFKLKNFDTITSVKKKADNLFCKLIDDAIKNIINNKIIVSKTKKENRYFKQRTIKDSLINFNQLTAKEVFNRFRACEKPYEAFYLNLNKKIIIKNLKILKKNENSKKNKHRIFRCKKNFVLVSY